MELFTHTGISDDVTESSIRIRSIERCKFGIVQMNFRLCFVFIRIFIQYSSFAFFPD